MDDTITNLDKTDVLIPSLTGAELNGKLVTAGHSPLYGHDQIEAVHALDTAESVEDLKTQLSHTNVDTRTTEYIIEAAQL
ncbi:hypothetical protein [Natrinema sp. DC36]|uniref:hypothetical protein n=1 Tax=Natrinema sp. DC36 TaxID=2878680 RepID=UPI001CF07A13|nr:hypothetical protein [Natrinema sp. DC36]